MCNSAIYTVNSSNTQIVTSNDQYVQVPLGSVVRRFGRALQLDGNSIVACGSGYYDCSVSLTVSPAAIGEVSARLYKDGQPVEGAFASGYASAAGNPVNLSLEPMVRNCGCNCTSTLTVWVNASCAVDSLSVKVRKV